MERRWVLPTFVSSIVGAVAWAAFCVYVLGEWDRKFVPRWGSFVLYSAFFVLVASYLAAAGLLLDVVLERLGRERLRGWSCFTLCAMGLPLLDGLWRLFPPGNHEGWVMWALLLGPPWGVQLLLRMAFTGGSRSSALAVG